MDDIKIALSFSKAEDLYPGIRIKLLDEQPQSPEQKIVLETHILPDNLFAFDVDGVKNVSRKKNHARNGSSSKIYKSTIPLLSGENLYTNNHQNNIRILQLGENGAIDIWEVSVISRSGRFYLITQMVYETCCYRQGESLKCTRFDDSGPNHWPQFMKYLDGLFRDIGSFSTLPEVPMVPLSKMNHVPHKDNRGYVVWWNIRLGIGVIKTTRGDVKVHHSELRMTTRPFNFLMPEEVVEFENFKLPVDAEVFEAKDVSLAS